MTWFRLDDSFHSHPKVLAAGNAAVGLFVRCGTYSAEHLTEGFVPSEVALMYGNRKLTSRLVEVGLWTPAPGVPPGWVMPDYLDYNPSKEQVESDRAGAAERQRRAREKARESREESRVTNGVSNGPPDPARPEVLPELQTAGADKPPRQPRRARVNDDFKVTNGMRAWAAENAPGVDLDSETAHFLDYHAGRGTVAADWTRTWHTWMRNAVKFAPARSRRGAPTDVHDLSSQDYSNVRI